MDVLELDVGVVAGQLNVGEVPEALHTQTHQAVGGLLGHGLGDGQQRHIHPVFLQKALQIVHGADGYAADGGAHHVGIHVEGGVHGAAVLGEGEVVENGVAQVAHADDDQVVVVVHAQNVADLRAQLLHVVAVALLAELAKAAEVLTDLGGSDVHLLAQVAGGDADHAAVVQVGELAVIAGKPADHRIGNVFFFHKDTSCAESDDAGGRKGAHSLLFIDMNFILKRESCQTF